MIEETDAEIRMIVSVYTPQDDSDTSHRSGILRVAYRLKTAFLGQSNERISVSSLDCLADAEWIEYNLSQDSISDNRITLPTQLVETIADSTDVVIHNGVGILSGSILNEPEYGVLSYHHGDIREYRGASGGYWEFLNDEDEMGVTLQQLTEELDGGRIIVYESVDISDLHTFSEIVTESREQSVPMLAEAIRSLEKQSFTPTEVDESELGELYLKGQKADPWVTLRFYIKNYTGRLRNWLNL